MPPEGSIETRTTMNNAIVTSSVPAAALALVSETQKVLRQPRNKFVESYKLANPAASNKDARTAYVVHCREHAAKVFGAVSAAVSSGLVQAKGFRHSAETGNGSMTWTRPVEEKATVAKAKVASATKAALEAKLNEQEAHIAKLTDQINRLLAVKGQTVNA